jgi:hypothetical protein
MPRSVTPLILNGADEAQIQRWLSAFGTPQQVALRGRIVLASAAGESDSAIAARLDTNRNHASNLPLDSCNYLILHDIQLAA